MEPLETFFYALGLGGGGGSGGDGAFSFEDVDGGAEDAQEAFVACGSGEASAEEGVAGADDADFVFGEFVDLGGADFFDGVAEEVLFSLGGVEIFL